MSPQAAQLFPEITVDSIVDGEAKRKTAVNFFAEEEHVYRIFSYYYADDASDRDQQLVQELSDSGQLQGPAEQALALVGTRQRMEIPNLLRSEANGHAVVLDALDRRV